MKNFIINVKTVFTMIFAALASWLGILYIPVILLLTANVIDYATGLAAAKYRCEHINSYKSLRGIVKKVCMWLLVAVGVILDLLLEYASDCAGMKIPFEYTAASLAAVWLIANEIISILENMKDIGVALPPFLARLASNIKSQSGDIGNNRKDD